MPGCTSLTEMSTRLAVVRAGAGQRRRVELESLKLVDRRLEADVDQLVVELLGVREIRAAGVVVPAELRADLELAVGVERGCSRGTRSPSAAPCATVIGSVSTVRGVDLVRIPGVDVVARLPRAGEQLVVGELAHLEVDLLAAARRGARQRATRKLFCAAIVASKLNLKVSVSTGVIESDFTRRVARHRVEAAVGLVRVLGLLVGDVEVQEPADLDQLRGDELLGLARGARRRTACAPTRAASPSRRTSRRTRARRAAEAVFLALHLNV